MSRLKKKRTHLNDAQARIAGMRSISNLLNFGDGLDLVTYQQMIDNLEGKLSEYNQVLSTVDLLLNEVNTAEEVLRDYSERMLASVAGRYGKKSSEYEMAGGTRKSERKKPVRKSTKADAVTPPSTTKKGS